jgi:K+-transporting ATPase ATPase A chain
MWILMLLTGLAAFAAMFATGLVMLLARFIPMIAPLAIAGLEPTQALHTAASIMTNTQQQHYSGEVSLSYLSQLMIVILDFTSPATSLAALAAIARAIGAIPPRIAFHIEQSS